MNVSPSTRICSDGWPLLGLDELRQEGEEEQRRLRVEDVDDDALGEVPAAAARRPLGIRVGLVGAPEQRADPDHDQVQRAEQLDDGERRRRRDENRRQPERREREMEERADVDPEHRRETGAAALVDAARDDVEHGRAGHGEDRERGEREDERACATR